MLGLGPLFVVVVKSDVYVWDGCVFVAVGVAKGEGGSCEVDGEGRGFEAENSWKIYSARGTRFSIYEI